ncbi:hypothetical protein [Micromonospora foliorum]|uniref:hypothetical protein n=1 Tax=Micromonospora foliorum TaxID=2911210 RepID=UPI001EE917A5|nr:hypothetical protein [Micromonospora foliorum]MCG5435249.1 hypothetical protein [Micromonospora foliorum]
MRIGRLWLTLGAAVALTLTWAPTASAVSWDNVKPYINSGISTSDLQKLVWSPKSATELAAVDDAYRTGLLSADGAPGLAQVYSHTNQQMYYKTNSACSTAKTVIADADAQYSVAAWCFTGADETSNAWLPQAITTSQDAEQSSGYSAGGDEVLGLWRQAATSSNRVRCPGVADNSASSVGLRATFIERPYTTGEHSAYRHVMLTVPTTDGSVIAPVCNVHGGGAVWYGPYLFVSRYSTGFMVFDTRRVYKIPYENTCGANGATPGVNDVGLIDGRVCAAGYRYVMVQIGSFNTTPSGCSSTPNSLTSSLCFSSMSLQWSDNSLVTAEYRNTSDMTASGVAVRLVNWPTAALIDRMTTGSTTAVTASRLAVTNFQGVQGVVQRPNATSGRSEFFIARTVTGSHDSELWYEQDGDGICAAKGVFVEDTESISYWVDSAGSAHLWTLTEYGGRRMLVRVYTKEYNDPPSVCPTQ